MLLRSSFASSTVIKPRATGVRGGDVVAVKLDISGLLVGAADGIAVVVALVRFWFVGTKDVLFCDGGDGEVAAVGELETNDGAGVGDRVIAFDLITK